MILIPDHVPSHFISCPLKFIIGGIISSQSSFFKSSGIDPSYLPFNSWSPCDLWYFLYIAYCELNPIAAATTVHNNCCILPISPPLSYWLWHPDWLLCGLCVFLWPPSGHIDASGGKMSPDHTVYPHVGSFCCDNAACGLYWHYLCPMLWHQQ